LSPKFPINNLPAAIKPPVSLSAYLEVSAKGVQIYACGKNDAGQPAWIHKGPDAELFDMAGKPFGKHYGGPSWEAPDGGKVIGALKTSVPAPQPGDIPWLLLDIKSREGEGVFTQAKAILRVNTKGGVAPPASPAGADEGSVVRVAYEALYLFLK
jgi:hypothetical protein